MRLETNNGKKSIICENKENSCRYNVCQCDKMLAEKLAEFEPQWDSTLHSVKGNFNRTETCIKGPQGPKFEECCGDTTTFPFNKPRNENQCCDGPVAKPMGQCY